MKLKLKDYQEVAVEGVVTEISDAVAKYEANQRLSAVSLSAPTGAGKTVIATAVIEKLLVGDGTREPNPGSDEARELGCRCPVLDNAHGRGAWGTSGDDAVFWTSETCPLHGWTDA